MKPMLAATVEDTTKLRYPLLASPKLDGIRGVIVDGKLRSRSLKPIPNGFVTTRFSRRSLDGLDGELILGSPVADDVYRQTNGACSRHEGQPDVKFYVFDLHCSALGFDKRLADVETLSHEQPHIVVHEHTLVESAVDLLAFENDCLDFGYEGVILRALDGAYKYGRSTLKEQGMLKLKRFVDGEAEIIEVYEEMENTNVKTRNELGRGTRSSHLAGLVPKGRAGGFHVRDTVSGIEFSVGTGLNDVDRAYYWKARRKAVGKVIKYKSFKIGVKDKPRHPVYLGPREKWDL